MQEQTISGIHMHYYQVCQRKLWLYDKGIAMENEYDRVLEGKVLHEHAYPQLQQKEILIDNTFKIDAIDGEFVREVKISSKMGLADRLQMLYYLYQLELRGIKKKGLISYTKEKKNEEILLDEWGKEKVEDAMAYIAEILAQDKCPPLKKVPYCKSCAYYSFCYALEVE